MLLIVQDVVLVILKEMKNMCWTLRDESMCNTGRTEYQKVSGTYHGIL